MRTFTTVALACVSALTLAACGPTPPTTAPTTPAPQPTFQCTPEAGGTPAPCSQREFDDMMAKNALYAEAEDVQKKFQAHVDTALRLGGTDSLSPALESVVAGPARDTVADVLRKQKQQGIQFVGDLSKTVFVHRLVGETVDGSDVALAVCTDMRHVRIVQNGQDIGKGPIGLDKLFFKRVNGTLKIWTATTEPDPTCA